MTTEDGAISVTINKTDMDIDQVWDLLLRPLLLAAGYQPSTVDGLVECNKTSGDVDNPRGNHTGDP